jgi:histidine phosphotransfer protein HptB
MDQPAPIFDVKQLERLSGLWDGADPTVLANLARGYLTRAPERLRRMRELLAADKVGQLADEAHALASSCGMFGMMRMRMGCKALENLVRAEGIVAAAGELLVGLEQSFAEARPHLVAALGLQD